MIANFLHKYQRLNQSSRFIKFKVLPISSIHSSTQALSSPDFVTPKHKLKSKYDAVIVGGGHNGLVSAAYLAKSGLSVAVFEKRHVVGGAAVTEEIVSGFKFSRASYVLSLLRPIIIKELQLKKYGLEVFERTTAAFTPVRDCFPNSLIMSSNIDVTCNEIAKFSTKDALAFRNYEDKMTKIASSLRPLLDHEVPSSASSLKELLSSASVFGKTGMNLGSDFQMCYELLTAPISKILDRWFESDPLKATLATDGVIGAMISPHTPGSGYVLLHHVIGELNGVQGAWGFAKGGMGAVSNAIAAAAKHHGADIFTSAEVEEIVTCDYQNRAGVKGILLKDGQMVQSECVLSNATAYRTFKDILPPSALPEDSEYLRQVEAIDYKSPVTKINVAVDTLPNFSACPNKSFNTVEEHHKGTIHINCENVELIHDAYLDASTHSIPSKVPMIEMCIPTTVDDSLAPKGKHVISLFTQYTPYHYQGKTWTGEQKQDYANNVFHCIDDYAPGFTDSIVGVDILTPEDLENVFGLTGGNIFHGAMSLDQLLFVRPTSLMNSYQTPIAGLYLCGSGTHPGGGVMGASGRLAALTAIKHRKQGKF